MAKFSFETSSRKVIFILLFFPLLASAESIISLGVSRAEVFSVTANSIEYFDDFYGISTELNMYLFTFKYVMVGSGLRYTRLFTEVYTNIFTPSINVRSKIEKFENLPFIYWGLLSDFVMTTRRRVFFATGTNIGMGYDFKKFEVRITYSNCINNYLFFEIGKMI